MDIHERTSPDQHHQHAELTGRVIASAYRVHRQLGFGFLESVYRRALAAELRCLGMDVMTEVPYDVVYRGVTVGMYRADLVPEGKVIVEVKTGAKPDPTAKAQLLNYLKVSGLQVGLILHFGPELQIKRLVFTPGQRPEHGECSAVVVRVP